jgi:hypothetical protein
LLIRDVLITDASPAGKLFKPSVRARNCTKFIAGMQLQTPALSSGRDRLTAQANCYGAAHVREVLV